MFYLLGSGFLSRAQTEDDSLDLLLGLDETEIQCDTIEDVFADYEQTIQLLTDAFSHSLNNVSRFLDDTLKDQTSQSDMVDQKTQIQNAQDIIRQNQNRLYNKSEHILYLIQECLNP